MAGAETIVDVVHWFCSKSGCWSLSTIRQYRAALTFTIGLLRLPRAVREHLATRLAHGPEPRPQGPRRTSARKRKSLRATRDSSWPDDKLIHGFLAFGPAIFLRPREYLASRVEGNLLITRNAKATNGRGNGTERGRELDMGPRDIARLVAFLEDLADAVRAAGSTGRLMGRLSARLARICKAQGIARTSLYTLRHVGMATAKSWMSPLEVAAAAGHASTRTASSHYAKKRRGWGIRLGGLPTATSLAAVREVGNPSFTERRQLASGPRPG
jgi:hypothetical protein